MTTANPLDKINYVQYSKRLEGKVALVIGASSGIGKTAAIFLANHGAKVVLAARRENLLKNTVDEINAKNPGAAKYIVCDVVDVNQIKNAVDFTVKQFGKIDVAVNNFGRSSAQDIRDLTEDNFDDLIAINTKGVAFAVKFECQIMGAQQELSSIINIGSSLSLVGMKGLAGYCASKHAVAGITKAAALDRVPNVRVNCLCPGSIRTEMGGFTNPSDKTPVPGIEKEYPIGRIGEAEDVANAIVFLASDESSFINGAIIPIDGGFICD